MAVDTGAEIDAALAEQMMRRLIVEAEFTLHQAVEEAPLEGAEEAAALGIEPGELRASAKLVYLVNEATFDSAPAAVAAVGAAARARRLYRVDAEIRFETIYARRQHDQLNWKHEIGKSRYLEDPIKAGRARLGSAFRSELIRFERGEWVHRLPGEKSR